MSNKEKFLLEGHGSRSGAFVIGVCMIILFVTTVHEWQFFFVGNIFIDVVKVLIYTVVMFGGFWGIANSLKTKVIISSKYFRVCSASTALRSEKIPVEAIDYIDLREVLSRIAFSPAHLKIYLKNAEKSYTIAGISDCRTFFPAFFNAIEIINQSDDINLKVNDSASFKHKKQLAKA